MKVMGIDPGKKGGIAILEGDEVRVMDMMELDKFVKLIEVEKPDYVVIEKQGVRPGNGVVSSGNLMKHYGELIGALTALRVNFKEVSAKSWRNFFWKKVKFKSYKERKEASLKLAKKMFPEENYGVKIGRKDGRAEALLIAVYGLATLDYAVPLVVDRVKVFTAAR